MKILKTHCTNGHELTPSNIITTKHKTFVCRTCARKCGLEYSRKPESKQKRREKHLLRNHNITEDLYMLLLQSQDFKCRICLVDLSKKRGWDIHLDHDHKTGKTRGILCKNCNMALGLFNDSITTIKNAVEYLKIHSNTF